jgi:hypothetical protein
VALAIPWIYKNVKQSVWPAMKLAMLSQMFVLFDDGKLVIQYQSIWHRKQSSLLTSFHIMDFFKNVHGFRTSSPRMTLGGFLRHHGVNNTLYLWTVMSNQHLPTFFWRCGFYSATTNMFHKVKKVSILLPFSL